jgi:predicted component of type VI protein secretion system
MKNVKKIILAFAIILVGIGCSSEQSKVEKAASKLVDKLNTACQLTPDETTRIKPLVKKFIETRRENTDKYASQQEALKLANETNRTNLIDSLKAILSPDQLEKFKAFTAQQKANRQGGQGDQGNGGQE